MKRHLALVALLAAASLALAEPDLRFALLPAESAIPLIVASEQGLFAAQGVQVELTMFQSPVDRNIVLQAGKLDGAIGDLMTVLAFREAGFLVTATSDINEDFKLLAGPKSGVASLAQLDGKDVAVVPRFALEYIMDRMAEKAGIGYRLVDIPSIPARFEALLSGRITAVVFTEPQATLLSGRGAVVLGGSKASGLQAGVLMFTDSALAAKPEALAKFYRAYDEAVDRMNAGEVRDYSALVTKYGFPEAVTSYLGSGVRYRSAQSVSQAMFDDILAWTKAKGMTRKDWSLGQVATDEFLK